MKAPEIPANEPARLQALRSYSVLDTPAEPAFDALTTLAAHIAGVPIALVSLVDADRQWFKSRYGLDAPETPRDVSFCGHVVATDAPLIVPDAWEDVRFAVLAEFQSITFDGGPHPPYHATFSAGVASYPNEASSLDELVAIADGRMYMGKRQGRGRVISG